MPRLPTLICNGCSRTPPASNSPLREPLNHYQYQDRPSFMSCRRLLPKHFPKHFLPPLFTAVLLAVLVTFPSKNYAGEAVSFSTPQTGLTVRGDAGSGD